MLRLKSSTVGFKEWSLVVDALGAGRQSLILRKGGIAEGRGGFQWQKSEFLLFPTHFHEQHERISWQPTPEAAADLDREEVAVLRYAARVEHTAELTEWSAVEALAPYHVWNEDVVRERFGYGEANRLSVAFVRVFRLPEPWELLREARYGGCRSWVDLPERGLAWPELEPVLSEAEHEARGQVLRPWLRAAENF